MSKILKICFLAFTVVSLAASKEEARSAIVPPTNVQEGYEGTIIYSTAEDDCEYVILLDGKRSVMFDPINLKGNYKKHGTKVWFTFRAMKIPNRCKKANPISITDIHEQALEKKDSPSKE